MPRNINTTEKRREQEGRLNNVSYQIVWKLDLHILSGTKCIQQSSLLDVDNEHDAFWLEMLHVNNTVSLQENSTENL